MAFPGARPIGRAFGVMQVTAGTHTYDITTFREDARASDGRRPDFVRFSDPEHDAHRRDFTINGMFYDPIRKKVIDYVGGKEDLKRRVIRAIGDPSLRFGEDYLRMLRAVRFAGSLAFSLEGPTRQAIVENAPNLASISGERIREELVRLFLDSRHQAGEGLRLLHETALLNVCLPEIEATVGQEQPSSFHPEGDVFTHIVMMLNSMDRPTVTLAFSILLHDVGKPPTATLNQEPDGTTRIRFNGHAKIGATMADNILRGLRFSNHRRRAIVHCVRNHMRFMEVQNMRKSTLRTLMAARTFPVELELHRLDCLCSNGDQSNFDFLKNALIEYETTPICPPPWITGHDLLALGMEQGAEIGRWLEAAHERQLNELAENREDLLEWIHLSWKTGRKGPGQI